MHHRNCRALALFGLVLFIILPISSYAGYRWDGWHQVNHKGVTNCGWEQAKSTAWASCRNKVRRGERLIDVKIENFDHQVWRDGFMNQERNCSHFANYKCKIQTNVPLEKTIDFKKATVVKNRCNFNVYVARVKKEKYLDDCLAGCIESWDDTSRGYYKVPPHSQKVIEGSHLRITSRNRLHTKTSRRFCHRDGKEFSFRSHRPATCRGSGEHLAGYEDVTRYNAYTLCR